MVVYKKNLPQLGIYNNNKLTKIDFLYKCFHKMYAPIEKLLGKFKNNMVL